MVPGIVLSTLSQEDNLMVVRLEKVTFAIISRTDSLKEEWTLKGCIYNGATGGWTLPFTGGDGQEQELGHHCACLGQVTSLLISLTLYFVYTYIDRI